MIFIFLFPNLQSEKEVFPFSVDDKDDVEMKGPKSSSSASSVCSNQNDKDDNPSVVKTEIKEEDDAAAGASGTVKSEAGNANSFSTQRLQHAVSKHPVSF